MPALFDTLFDTIPTAVVLIESQVIWTIISLLKTLTCKMLFLPRHSAVSHIQTVEVTVSEARSKTKTIQIPLLHKAT